jgi:hypothetical protein
MHWVLSDEELVTILRRVANGEDPLMVHMELYANSQGVTVTPEED